MGRDLLSRCSSLVVDATGVGMPVVDLLGQGGLRAIAVPITAGDNTSREGASWRVPKRDLVGVLQVLLQTGRLKVAEGLPEAQTLVEELLGFQVKITDAGRDTYGAWREGAHDDLVLATALACWYGERGGSCTRVLSEKKTSRWTNGTSTALVPSGRRPWHGQS